MTQSAPIQQAVKYNAETGEQERGFQAYFNGQLVFGRNEEEVGRQLDLLATVYSINELERELRQLIDSLDQVQVRLNRIEHQLGPAPKPF